MKSRTTVPAFALCAVSVVLAPLAGCGGGASAWQKVNPLRARRSAGG
ncbi:hypothetical protein ACWD26_24180 [Streptomyces sp. NPDC002787]